MSSVQSSYGWFQTSALLDFLTEPSQISVLHIVTCSSSSRQACEGARLQGYKLLIDEPQYFYIYFCVMMRFNIIYNLHDLSNVWIKLLFDTFMTLFGFFYCNELWVNISVKSGKVCTSGGLSGSLQRVRLRLLVDCLNWRFGQCPLPGNSPCKSAKWVKSGHFDSAYM